ncbi:MAG: hypothetical protein FVQ83_02535 [Chloroflexi bacterium]|nr:hypothetical protein [Chloroflexota bacterium]
MEDIIFQRWILAALGAMVITIGFDSVLHGLSHSGHGLLNKIWEQEDAERISSPRFFSSIGWHIFADAFLAIPLSLIIVLMAQPEIIWALWIGIIIGGIGAAVWAHVHAAFEVGRNLILTLSFLNLIQVILASIVAHLIYWGV